MLARRVMGRIRRALQNPIHERHHELMMLNNKMLNYEAAREPIEALRKSNGRTQDAPGYVGLGGKVPTQADIEAPWMIYWCQQMGLTPVYHRKIWEFAYALQVLSEQGMMTPGKRGIGFGCGTEPIASVLVKHGVEVTISDQDAGSAVDGGWAKSGQHAATLEAAFKPEIVDRPTFDRLAKFRLADMRDLKGDLGGYDFCWSMCAFEHLGSLQAGLDFVVNAMKTLKPGGIAVHTTELNVSESRDTLETKFLVLYQRKHLEALATRLAEHSHQMCERSYLPGEGVIDRLVDFPPYILETDHWLHPLRKASAVEYDEPHLKLAAAGYPTTSFAFWVRHG